MGITVYWLILALVVILGMVMPQQGHRRKYYIILMAALHAFVSGFRYQYLTGDLLKYAWGYHNTYPNHGYFSEEVLNKWVNTGFFWMSKFLSDLSGGDFQVMLVVAAVLIELALAILIYKYSPRPWLSYLVWNCIGFYIFGFSALKQSIAMALVMLAMDAILDDRPKRFLLFALLAGFVHFPAFAFLPAYWIARAKIRPATLLAYIVAAILIFVFQNPIVSFITNIYYEEGELMLADSVDLGGRFYMMVVILVMGACLKGFRDTRFNKLFNLMVVAAIFQMFAGYDNIFTRFADYYFQISVLFLPLMVSSDATNPQLGGTHRGAAFPFNRRSLTLIAFAMAVYLVWYYNRTTLSQTIEYAVDDYLNYRSMWDVQ